MIAKNISLKYFNFKNTKDNFGSKDLRTIFLRTIFMTSLLKESSALCNYNDLLKIYGL